MLIDTALGSIFDAIGATLEAGGREDSSGARRAVADRLAKGDFGAAARLLGCTEACARDLKAKFAVKGTP